MSRHALNATAHPAARVYFPDVATERLTTVAPAARYAAPVQPPKKPQAWKTVVTVILAVIGVLFLAAILAGFIANSGDSGGTNVAPIAPVNNEAARAVSAEEWAAITRNPAAARGQAIVVYGVIVQADAATGTGTARALLNNARQESDFDYNTNALLNGEVSRMVQGQSFRAEVVVAGTVTYDTTNGGQVVAPVFTVRTLN